MKSSRAATLIIVALISVPPYRAHAGSPPALAADNTVTSVGPAATLVSLDQTVIVPLSFSNRWYTSWMSFETTGTYAGVALQELPRSDGGTRKTLLNVRLMPPVGCTTSGVCDSPDQENNLPWSARREAGGEEIIFEPGTYLLYAFTDPGDTMTAHWHLPMLSGEQQFTATMPLQFQTKATTVAPVGGVGKLDGTHTGHLSGDGLVSGHVWETYALHGSQNGVVSLNLQWNWQCIQRTDDRFDPLGMCGYPPPLKYPEDESGISMNTTGNSLSASAGDWSHVFRLVDVTPPDGQLGAFTFWLTFLSPLANSGN